MARRKVKENFPLELSGSNLVGEKENEGKKKKEMKRKNKESGVRSSTLSLRFTEIEPSVFVGVRGKVHLCDESFA